MTTLDVAPGHPYHPETKTGIVWTPTSVTLHAREFDGTPHRLEAAHTTASPYAFWSTFAFREAFPSVTHWWFGDAWTGSVRVSPFTIDPDGTVRGAVQFGTEESQGLPYEIDATTFLVAAPMPPLFVRPRNLALRRYLAEMVLAQVAAEASDRLDRYDFLETFLFDALTLEPDTWYGVTSLVEAADLERYFPDRPSWWQLPPFAAGMTWRQMFCQALGVTP